eukprot:TRINITY_DN12612_c0_g1_i1.p1 TRINITY_DN12612_c0_g1~~TRINITY_DN12612_c0_g1_i1.p1  ORF type:complete len:600 (-),score=131.73 TRINITY_DN12612_c0_g1_i1:90-1829(-)
MEQAAALAGKGPAEITTFVEAFLREDRALLEARHSILLSALRGELDSLGSGWASTAAADSAVSKAPVECMPVQAVAIPANQEIEDEGKTAEEKTDAGETTPSILKRNSQLAKRSKLGETFAEKKSETVWILFQPSKLVRSNKFELFYAMVILANTLVMAVESQYKGFDSGHMLGFKRYDRPSHEMWPGADDAFAILETIFGVFFLIEWLVKILGHRGSFIWQAWNWFDTVLVVFWIADTALANMPVDGSLLRLVRLARLLRLLRLARAVQGFDSLVVMTTALQGSMSALFWVAILLLVVQMMFALFLNQILMNYVEDTSQSLADRQKVFEYFGTFSRAMLTMFELTLGNWVPVARLLQENVSGYLVVFSIAHKVSLGFACVGVVNGVFMQETFKVAQSDDAMLMRGAENRRRMHIKKMTEFLQYTDDSGDGKISKSEWTECLKNQHVHHWFSGQGVGLGEADRLFECLETDGDGKLSPEELVSGVSRLQGPAKSLDLTFFKEDFFKGIQDVADSLSSRMTELDHKIAGLQSNLLLAEAHRLAAVKGEQEAKEVNETPSSPGFHEVSQEEYMEEEGIRTI